MDGAQKNSQSTLSVMKKGWKRTKTKFLQSQVIYLASSGLRYFQRNGLKGTLIKVRVKLADRNKLIAISRSFDLPADQRTVEEKTAFNRDIKFSVMVPLYNTPENFLEEMIASVRAQTYKNWELCLADGSDAAHCQVRKICEKHANEDSRIRYLKLEKNMGISGNTNACIKMATGDFIGLFDHDDLLHPSVLFEVMQAICTQNADFVYTDELTFSGKITNVISSHFKPDYAPDNLRANNYICHFSVFSREIYEKVGGFRSEYDGSQDHDFILRATAQAEKVVHVPKILYFWRSHPNSVAENIEAKSYAIDAGKRAVADHIRDRGMDAEVESSRAFPTIYRLKYALQRRPRVSIIIHNKNHYEDLKRCIDSILQKTTYENYEILIVDNGSDQRELINYYDRLQDESKAKVIKCRETHNFSQINNYGVRFALGEQILLLSNDTEVIEPQWIEEMLMYAQREDVGAVGAKLYYENKRIQHAGMVLALGKSRTAGRIFYKYPGENVGYIGKLCYAQNISAVSGACMMVRRDVWEKVGGLDETFAEAFSDVDMCLRIRDAGYLVVWTPYAELYHYKSQLRSLENAEEKRKRFEEEANCFKSRWSALLESGDPYYNPNLTLDRPDYSMK